MRTENVCRICDPPLTFNRHNTYADHLKYQHNEVPVSGTCLLCRADKKGCDGLRPTCGRCQKLRASCDYQDATNAATFLLRPLITSRSTSRFPTQDEYKSVLRHYATVYELFPLFHPTVLAILYKSALVQDESESPYLWGMIDSISSLFSLYAEKSGDTVQLFYESASYRLQGFRSASIEGFICETILAIVTLHKPTLREGRLPVQVKSKLSIDTRMRINNALRTIQITRLEELDGQLESKLSILQSVAFTWHGLPFARFAAMLRDTWRRVFCHLVVVDQDAEKVKGQTMMCISSVLGMQIDYSAQLEENSFSGLLESDPDVDLGSRWTREEIYEPLKVLMETVKIFELREAFLRNPNHDLPTVMDFADRILEQDASLVSNVPILKSVLECRYNLTRLIVTRVLLYNARTLEASTRRKIVRSAIEIIRRFGSQVIDKRLKRWYSIHKDDLETALLLVDHACKVYPESEIPDLVQARLEGIEVAKMCNLTVIAEGFERTSPGALH